MSKSSSSSTSSNVTSTTRPGGGTSHVIKIRAGGSGQSSLALKMQADKIPNNGRMPVKPTPTTTPTTSSPATANSRSNQVATVIKPTSSTSSKPTAFTTTATSTSQPQLKSPPGINSSTKSTASTSSASFIPSSTTSQPSQPQQPKSLASTYVNPNSYEYPDEGTTTLLSETPNGISLDLSGSKPIPQLLAVKNRSDRLREACMKEDKSEVVNLLGQGTDPNQTDAYGNSALMLAAGTGNVDIVDELLTHGANVQAKDKYGQTPLIFACSKGHYEVAKMLVEKKAGVNVTTMHGQTALMKVCYISHVHSGILAELLLTHKAKTDLQTPDGSSATFIATLNDHMELLEILAHYGANLNLQRKTDLKTILHLAAEKSSFTMVSNLIAMGAALDIKDAQHRTFLEVTPLPPPGSSVTPPLADFRAKLHKAHERGLVQKQEREEMKKEHAEIIAKIKAEKLERLRLELVQAKIQEGYSKIAAEQSVVQDMGLKEEKHFYIDDEGVEHYSRPSSAKMTYAEMKARTYKPKIDPTSVFGDSTPAPAAATNSYSLTASATSASSSYHQPPTSYHSALDHDRREDEDQDADSDDEMKLVDGY